MADENRCPEVFCFGAFAVDVRAGELGKHALVLKVCELLRI